MSMLMLMIMFMFMFMLINIIASVPVSVCPRAPHPPILLPTLSATLF